MSERIAHRALYEQVADRLRLRIYHNELKPGDWIDEKALCEAFGISRTPLREALKVLSAEGLIELIPRRGCFVKRLAQNELDELFPVVAVLEGLSARETAMRITPAQLKRLDAMHERLERLAAAGDVDAYYDENCRFHHALLEFSGNRYLQRTAADLRKILRLARHHQLTLPGRLEHSLDEHRQIMEALRQGDPALADRCMQEHLMHQWQASSDVEAHTPEARSA